ncbi:MAG: metallophosphoesterase [Pseudomonadales bacterium]
MKHMACSSPDRRAATRRQLCRLLLGLCCVLPLVAQTADTGTGTRFTDVERVVAFGDVHGAYGALVDVLKAAKILDADLHWSGGETHLVSLGDLLDRGPDSRQVLDLLMRLQEEAGQAGGRVHVILGNHEVMNLTGDLRYVSAGEFAAFAKPGDTSESAGHAEHRRAFAPTGHYGEWLLRQPVMILINDTAFVHGGLSTLAGTLTPEAMNARVQATLRDLLSAGAAAHNDGLLADGQDLIDAGLRLTKEPAPVMSPALTTLAHAASESLLGDMGPLWYRGNALCHPLIEGTRLARTLASIGARRVVIGHTPTRTRRVTSRLDDQVIALDTGMLAAVYRGIPSALRIEDDVLQVVTATGTDRVYAEQSTAAPANGAAPPGEQAARQLDRLLGLDIVDTGQDSEWLSEGQRQTLGLRRDNTCEAGSDYLLVSVFDALIGNPARTVDTLGYDRVTLKLRLKGHERAFGRGRVIRTAAVAVPPALRQRLSALTPATLDAALGSVLDKRAVRALLQRRDIIVADWPELD